MGKAEDGTFSVRGLTRLIIPLMIGLTLDLIVGIIDSVMLSGSGEAAVSGVSLVDSLIQLLIYIFAALAAAAQSLRGNIWARGSAIATLVSRWTAASGCARAS